MEQLDNLYQTIEEYAREKDLSNTLIALPLAKKLLGNIRRQIRRTDNKDASSLEHCLKAAKMLMDLHVQMSAWEEDVMLASMLCHNMIKKANLPDEGQELVSVYHMDARVLDVIRRIKRPGEITEEALRAYYRGILGSDLAVLVSLANRCDLVEELSDLDISDVNEFVCEMRDHFLPTCVAAKERYHRYAMTMTIMMEKIRCLIDVTDIISNRYQKRAMSYHNEILSLMEENARLRGMIRQFGAGGEQ